MVYYTLGFIFNSSLNQVLLVHKLRPDWQNGKVNGIGGKIEEGEESLACIVSEVQEESGLIIGPDQWVFFGVTTLPDAHVDVYTTIYKGDASDIENVNDEKIEWCDINKLPSNIITNLSWLVPMALDKIKNNAFKEFSLEY